MSESWEVQLAQFIPSPACSSSKYRNGAWITSKAAATATIYREDRPTLVVVLNGKIHEEHLVSELSFAWARTTENCRVILASYATSGARQKFAMRFVNDVEATNCFQMLRDTASRPSPVSGSPLQADAQMTTDSVRGPEAEAISAADATDKVRSTTGLATIDGSLESEPVDRQQALKEQIVKCLMDPSFASFVKEVGEIWHELEGSAMRLLIS